MDERQAWTFLENLWTRAKMRRLGFGVSYACVEIGGELIFSLCLSIDKLHSTGQITESVRWQMRNAIPKPRGAECYVWPLTLEGAAARAEFCGQQAARLGAARRAEER